jgi:hypothetical protein
MREYENVYEKPTEGKRTGRPYDLRIAFCYQIPSYQEQGIREESIPPELNSLKPELNS